MRAETYDDTAFVCDNEMITTLSPRQWLLRWGVLALVDAPRRQVAETFFLSIKRKETDTETRETEVDHHDQRSFLHAFSRNLFTICHGASAFHKKKKQGRLASAAENGHAEHAGATCASCVTKWRETSKKYQFDRGLSFFSICEWSH